MVGESKICLDSRTLALRGRRSRSGSRSTRQRSVSIAIGGSSAAIVVDSKVLLDAEVFGCRGTDPAAAFLHGLTGRYGLDDTEYLVDGLGYLTVLSRLDLSGGPDKHHPNHIETWFQTLKMQTDRFHTSWVGSRASSRHWLSRFVHHDNRNRPHQALSHCTPAEEVLN